MGTDAWRARPAPTNACRIARPLTTPSLHLKVVGAHLTGRPLNGRPLALGGRFVRTTTTASAHRPYALDTTPSKPGPVRVREGGAAVPSVERTAPARGPVEARRATRSPHGGQWVLRETPAGEAGAEAGRGRRFMPKPPADGRHDERAAATRLRHSHGPPDRASGGEA
ncbi:hypothetical protein [Streptomyces sp. NPDC014656]|uniref:allophanate hydrolase-related protein n=1 Tax=Streptomyces sp. NPDC014656 TaxID=3364878 RepID=UPI0036F9254E